MRTANIFTIDNEKYGKDYRVEYAQDGRLIATRLFRLFSDAQCAVNQFCHGNAK